ncbi:YcdB/YcdC domain-containing protein [Paenibacillus sp. PK3_47]|uniref:YcdB/YcdC domain-containing protein n=1 Tax=Paenibacillus sp. PK3_47 TaxID=2072642 RepID=UPI00201E44AA|nr:YcdB/YcdC domain-containing protein [Paenibacillus sp. PK3_47]
MKSNQIIHQTTKAALITTVALALLLPGNLAAAESVKAVSPAEGLQQAAGETVSKGTPDPADAKITKDEAVAKVRKLFPALQDATVSNVQLGDNGTVYPPAENQMIWNINWQYSIGNSSYGFSSTVDAMNGDLISTYLHFPFAEDVSYYPPKVTRAEALEKAKSFITAAAPSLKSGDLQLDENTVYVGNGQALFGPVQHSFSFNLLKNGLPSSDSLMIVLDGDGNVTSFNKPSTSKQYPSAKPAVTLEQAEKKFKDGFEVALSYIPVYKNGTIKKWVLGWQPQEQSVYAIDAQSGRKIDSEGSEAADGPLSYEAVPPGKQLFQPVSSGKELTAEEAAKRVQEAVGLPKERKLVSQTLSPSYLKKGENQWMLNWGDAMGDMRGGMPGRSFAVINASTGEISQFQLDQFSSAVNDKPKAQAAGKKLTPAEAKQKAVALISRLYNNASSELKLIEHGGTWSVLPEEQGYRYQFIRYHQGIPVNDGYVTLQLDNYGVVTAYYGGGDSGVEDIAEPPVPAVPKAKALQSYLDMYELKLQYSRIGGYYMTGYIEPEIKLVYSPQQKDSDRPFGVLDAVSGKWVTVYEGAGLSAKADSAADLKGHPAEKQLTELLKYGVLTPDEEGKLNPDQEITVGDWYTIIAKASTPYFSGYSSGEAKDAAGVHPESPYYNAINYAVTRSWISSDEVVQPEKKLTREELAVTLVTFLKYTKLSAFLQDDAVLNGFSDSAAIQDKGAAALSVRLGLLQAENGKFNPQQNVTKAQAAAIVMKLVELQGRVDQAIGERY